MCLIGKRLTLRFQSKNDLCYLGLPKWEARKGKSPKLSYCEKRLKISWEVQLSLSSRAIHGGAYFSDVSGWNSILISVPGPCEVTEWHRLLGFCLTITFSLNPAHQAVSLWNCRVYWRICLFYLYGFVTNGKYLWSPRREILQYQWQFQ